MSQKKDFEKFVYCYTAIKMPISTEIKITPKNAPMQAMKSNLSIFHSRITASISTRLTTADIMIAARMAFGMYLNRGVMTINVRKTIIDMTMLETAV